MAYIYRTASNISNLLRFFVSPGIAPLEFNGSMYKMLHDDLAHVEYDVAHGHYLTTGKSEGRIASPGAVRGGLIASIPADASILEIGPFTRPVFWGENVRYFDVLDREGLLDRAKRENFPIEREVEIDYVSPTGDLSILPDQSFDYVFSSHVIQHLPDLISHLHHVTRALKPGGVYSLIVPDKRFCFDHFALETSLDDVLRAHVERRTVHSIQNVHHYCAVTTHNDPLRHWEGDHTDPRADEFRARAEYAIKIFEAANGDYIDVPAWFFTPDVFRAIMNSLFEGQTIDLQPTRVYDTPYGVGEFCAILQKIVR